MNIDSPSPVGYPRERLSEALLLSLVVERLPAGIDEYGCLACMRKSCPGCSERLMSPTRDQWGLPF